MRKKYAKRAVIEQEAYNNLSEVKKAEIIDDLKNDFIDDLKNNGVQDIPSIDVEEENYNPHFDETGNFIFMGHDIALYAWVDEEGEET